MDHSWDIVRSHQIKQNIMTTHLMLSEAVFVILKYPRAIWERKKINPLCESMRDFILILWSLCSLICVFVHVMFQFFFLFCYCCSELYVSLENPVIVMLVFISQTNFECVSHKSFGSARSHSAHQQNRHFHFSLT